MELELRRFKFTEHATIGALSAPDPVGHICWILEDKCREKAGTPVSEWKIPGKTAIPAGRYKITRTMSARFKKVLPLLNEVPGFLGVRIHPGNSEDDTEGCLLPGEKMGDDVVIESRHAFNRLDKMIEEWLGSGEEVWITIRNVIDTGTVA